MASLLVTGGAGFIGSNFVHYWLRSHPGDSVTVLDSLTYAGNLASLEPARAEQRFRFIHGDILDRECVDRILSDHSIDTIVHLAAESHVDRSIHGPGAFIQANLVGTYTLLEAARTCWLKDGSPGNGRFHHVSTDEVYGSLGPEDPAFDEDTSYAPNSPYSASKAGSDHLVRAYHHTYGLEVTTSNCSNNYGPYQFPEKLIPLMLVNALHGRALPIYGDGMNVRDWLFVEDHCRGIEAVLLHGRSGRTYCIGGNTERTNMEIVRQLCLHLDERLGSEPSLQERFPDCPASSGSTCGELVSFVKDRPGHDRRYAIDATRIEGELGFRPVESFESGLALTIDWYLRNESWWRGIMDGSYRQWIDTNYGS
ncbi:MAG: dTDP-glucose 4,6-dehydratase [Phycisphaerae bacterium]|nr:dTDP-glucose 4,6-dehydratase [Phycisphaerae bacterium]